MPKLNPSDQRLLERCTTHEERIAFLDLYNRDPLRWNPPQPLILPPSLHSKTADLIRLFCHYHPEPTPYRHIDYHNLAITLSRFLVSSYVTQLATDQRIPHYQLTSQGIQWIDSLCQNQN